MKRAKRPRGRPKAAAETEVIQVRLPIAMADKLRGTPKGIGAEIRDRLAESIEFAEMPADARDLINAVRWIAEELRHQASGWSATKASRSALLIAIETWMDQSEPASEGGAVNDLFGAFDPPTLGRSIARHYVRLQQANAETVREAKKAQQQREARNGK